MKKFLAMLILSVTALSAAAQGYVAPEVRISQDKVRIDGKIYYTHVVLEKQTMYSICHAYNVVPVEIYEANAALNLETAGLKAGQILLIPVKEATADVPEAQTAEESQMTPVTFAQDSTYFVMEMPDVINVSMILPLNTKGISNSNYFDFYCGALIAARDLGRSGKRIDFSVFDTADKTTPVTSHILAQSDVIIGPVSPNDIQSTLRICPSDKYVISPLEPKAAGLADSCRVIQAAAPSGAQTRELADWIKEDMKPEDALVVISESGYAVPAAAKNLLDEIKARGLNYGYITYDILQGLKIYSTFTSRCSTTGTTRFVIASEHEAFVGDAIRNINLLTTQEYNVALYCTSKVRSYETVEIENLYGAGVHMTASFYIDYSDPEVRKFVLAYRALFDAEPTQFAFHGYDTMHYFTEICAKYGRHWPAMLNSYDEHGLQTEFGFPRTYRTGYVNSDVRRVIYRKDLTTEVVR